MLWELSRWNSKQSKESAKLAHICNNKREETMNNGILSVEEFVEVQAKTWKTRISKEKKEEVRSPVITVCMEPGSGGSIVAQEIAKQLDFDFFHRDIINEIAKSSHISSQVIETLEKERLSGINDFISSLIKG